MSIVWVVLGFALLVVGGEFLVRSSVALSFKFNISKMVIGMTVVSFATSAPELLVSLQAALLGSPAIDITNVVGSNIANIGLVLGVTAMISTIVVDKSFYRLNWPVMMLFSIVLFYFLKNDNMLSVFEGVILFFSLVVFLVILIKNTKDDDEVEEVDDGQNFEHKHKVHSLARIDLNKTFDIPVTEINSFCDNKTLWARIESRQK